MPNNIYVISDKCTGCSLCFKNCPYAAITLTDRPDHPRKQKLAVIDLNKCTYCGACVEACKKFGAIVLEKETVSAAVDLNQYRGVWVYAEQRHGEIAPVVLELLGEGRKIADKLQVPLSAILLGHQIHSLPQELISYGADKVYVLDDVQLTEFQDEPYADLLAQLIKQEKPEIILMGASSIGRSFASRVAAKIDTGLTADCTALEVDVNTRNLYQTRPAFGGNIMATILTSRHRPQMATVRHKVMKRAECNSTRQGQIITVPVDLSQTKIRTAFIEFIKDETQKVNLTEANIIVTGGRGLGKPEGFKLIEELAQVLGGAVGASRAVVDAGWISYAHQVGQTGRTVSPKLYVACGVSGSVQHLAGMSSSEIIVAINTDPAAPIMKIATYAIPGDLYEVIPELIKQIKLSRGESKTC